MSNEQRIAGYAGEIAEILGGFFSTMLGGSATVTAQPASETTLDDAQVLTASHFTGLSNLPAPHTFAVLFDKALLAPLSQVMLGEAMTIEDEGAADLMMEAYMQGYSTVRNQFSEITLPDATFQVLSPGTALEAGQIESGLWRIPFEIASDGTTIEASLLLSKATMDALEDKSTAQQPASAAAPQPATSGPGVEAAAAGYPNLGGEALKTSGKGNFELLSEVQLNIAVELGRRKIALQDVLQLTMGSVIELEKLVGEPLEIYANGQLIAEGEAVVIDEQFGVRVTNLASGKNKAKSFA